MIDDIVGGINVSSVEGGAHRAFIPVMRNLSCKSCACAGRSVPAGLLGFVDTCMDKITVGVVTSMLRAGRIKTTEGSGETGESP
jgi:hypothetical protein